MAKGKTDKTDIPFDEFYRAVETACHYSTDTSSTEDTEPIRSLSFSHVNWKVSSNQQNTHPQENKKCVLLQGIKTGKQYIVEHMLHNIPKLDLNYGKDNLPLHFACYWGYQDIVELLLKNGANVRKKSQLNIDGNIVVRDLQTYGIKDCFRPEESCLLMITSRC